MSKIYKFELNQKIRLCYAHNLIFFVLIFSACARKNDNTVVSVVWQKGNATGISIPLALLPDLPSDSFEKYIRVKLASSNENIAMLGDYAENKDRVVFKPLIPLSQGGHYEISYQNNLIAQIAIPVRASARPKVLAIYPSSDTLPENLLKIYICFSQPMREGVSQTYVAMLDAIRDTVPAVFLDLQPELWNTDRTVLTLWLDPGRIKRDLQPNQRMGNPLKKGQRYTISVSQKWTDTKGKPLKKGYTKTFLAFSRDGMSPSVNQWKLKTPQTGSRAALQIVLPEPLDFFLLNETIRIEDLSGKAIAGTLQVGLKEQALSFFPNKPWKTGKYVLTVEPRLEDLAGNNMQRLFDTDVKSKKETVIKQVYLRDFELK